MKIKIIYNDGTIDKFDDITHFESNRIVNDSIVLSKSNIIRIEIGLQTIKAIEFPKQKDVCPSCSLKVNSYVEKMKFEADFESKINNWKKEAIDEIKKSSNKE